MKISRKIICSKCRFLGFMDPIPIDDSYGMSGVKYSISCCTRKKKIKVINDIYLEKRCKYYIKNYYEDCMSQEVIGYKYAKRL